MGAPYEIIGAPYTVYLGPVGEAFPALDDAVAGNWFKLGTSGDLNYGDDGVTVSHPQSIELFRPAGSPLPRKAFRKEEDLKIAFALADLSPEQYAKVMDDAAITTVAAAAGVPGEKYFELARGLNVTTFALLARGISSVDDALAAQYQVEACFQSGEPEPVHNKGEAAMLEVEFTGLDVAGTGDIGELHIQTAAAA